MEIRNRLSIVKDAPSIFFHDEPKSRFFEVSLRLGTPLLAKQLVFSALPLRMELVYADGTTVCDQSILQCAQGLDSNACNIRPHEVKTYSFRVSQGCNLHGGKLFRIKFWCEPGHLDLAALTIPIDVQSQVQTAKLITYLGVRRAGMQQHMPPCSLSQPVQASPIECPLLQTPDSLPQGWNDVLWVRFAAEWIKKHMWQQIGVELGNTSDCVIDNSRPIFRCIGCGILSSTRFSPTKHWQKCPVSTLMEIVPTECSQCTQSTPAPKDVIAVPVRSLRQAIGLPVPIPISKAIPIMSAAPIASATVGDRATPARPILSFQPAAPLQPAKMATDSQTENIDSTQKLQKLEKLGVALERPGIKRRRNYATDHVAARTLQIIVQNWYCNRGPIYRKGMSKSMYQRLCEKEFGVPVGTLKKRMVGATLPSFDNLKKRGRKKTKGITPMERTQSAPQQPPHQPPQQWAQQPPQQPLNQPPRQPPHAKANKSSYDIHMEPAKPVLSQPSQVQALVLV